MLYGTDRASVVSSLLWAWQGKHHLWSLHCLVVHPLGIYRSDAPCLDSTVVPCGLKIHAANSLAAKIAI